MRTITIMLVAALAGCGADRVLESGRYLCATDVDCQYGWKCLESPELHRGACFAPDLEPQMDAGAHDAAAPTDAMAGWSGLGVRWTNAQLVRPESIKDIANLQIPAYVADGTITVLVTARPVAEGGIELRGGSGAKLAADPLTYSFTADMRPPVVHAAVDGAGGFATDAAFDWGFVFLPGQPTLDVRHATLSGTLDVNGQPTGGTYKGCMTTESMAGVYIEVLGKTVEQLVAANGGSPDCDATTGGSVDAGSGDGFVIEMRWSSSEIVTLVDAPTGG
ncbi:MAG TPA: hypothetical protein VGQ83_32305 [Polyangia bacterium]|jgi:hypothetical protein